MANRIISIEVGYSVTKICEMDFRARNPRVYKYFSVPTPEGIYEDGFISENPAFAASIKQGLNFNKIKTRQAVCTITSSKIATREIQLPNVKANQVQALVEANAGDYFPIDLTDYELGHLVLGNVKEEDGTNKLKVMAFACQKQLIDGYDKLCEAAGLHMISVDYTGNSVYQIMKGELKEDTEMVLKVEEKQAIATILTGNTLAMQRNIVYGVENAIYTMMDSSAFPQKTFAEAMEEFKRIRCIKLSINEGTKIVEQDDDDLQVSEKVSAAMKDITDALAPLIGNIGRVLDLYNSKNPDHPVKRILIIGLGADISGLSKLFTNELGVKTQVCGSVKNISWNHAAGDGSSGRYVATIGAGIAPIGFINEEKKKSDLKDVNYRNTSILVAILCIVVCAVLYLLGYMEYQTQKNKETTLKLQEAQYLPAETVHNQKLAMEDLYIQVLAADELTTGANDDILNFLDNLEKVLPSDSIITSFQSDRTAANITIKVLSLEEASKMVDTLRGYNERYTIKTSAISTEDMTMEEYAHLLVAKGIMSADTFGFEEEEEEAETESPASTSASEEKEEKKTTKTSETSVSTSGEETEEEADFSMLEDEDGNRITTFTDENGNEITVSDTYYIVNLTVVYPTTGTEEE